MTNDWSLLRCLLITLWWSCYNICTIISVTTSSYTGGRSIMNNWCAVQLLSLFVICFYLPGYCLILDNIDQFLIVCSRFICCSTHEYWNNAIVLSIQHSIWTISRDNVPTIRYPYPSSSTTSLLEAEALCCMTIVIV